MGEIQNLDSIFTMEEEEQGLSKLLKLCHEKNRQETFKTWIFPDQKKCNASKLAEAGFCFIGNKTEPDTVQCIFCNKTLDGWEENDDPWVEHQQHSSECQFIKLNKPESKLTVYEYIDLQSSVTEIWLKKIFKIRKEGIIDIQRKLKKELQTLKKKGNQRF